jgi:hypothetical protein
VNERIRRNRRNSLIRVSRLVVCLCPLIGCITTVPAPVAKPRAPTPIHASFATTWTSAVDVFADKNIGIRTIDRSSGLIIAEPVRIPQGDIHAPSPLADCGGTNVIGQRTYNRPLYGVYNVRVRGDTATSTVFVTVRWSALMGASKDSTEECATTGQWESGFEQAVVQRAERR